jgi:tetratricopeptide (TPR) repeat protein
VEDLLALGVDALNPRKQYYTQLEKYEQGGKDYTIMAYLARTANSLGETDMAQTIAKDYADHYLFRLEDKDLYFKENIEFVREFTESSKDLGFLMFYQHGDKVDKVMEDSSYSQGFVDYIIAKEEIDQVLWPVKAVPPAVPDWRKIKSTITQKYGKSYADRTITGAKVRWYGWKRDWPEFTKSKVILVNRYGTNMSNFDLDVHSWDMFLHSREKNELNDAINWIKRVLQKEPDWPNAIDTYANLLYKTDRKQEALIWEEKAARLAPEDKGIQENFMKMKKSEPTWETN